MGEGLLAAVPENADGNSSFQPPCAAPSADARAYNDTDAAYCEQRWRATSANATTTAGSMLYPEIEMLDPLAAWRERERARKIGERRRRAEQEAGRRYNGQPGDERRGIRGRGSGEEGEGCDSVGRCTQQKDECGAEGEHSKGHRSLSHVAALVDTMTDGDGDREVGSDGRQSAGGASESTGVGGRALARGEHKLPEACGTLPDETTHHDALPPLPPRPAPHIPAGAAFPPASVAQRYEPTSPHMPLGSSNKGFELLRKMGWSGGGVGAQEQGRADPVAVDVRASRLGLGARSMGSLGKGGDGKREKREEAAEKRQQAREVQRKASRERGARREQRDQELAISAARDQAGEVSNASNAPLGGARKHPLSLTCRGSGGGGGGGGRNFDDLSARLGTRGVAILDEWRSGVAPDRMAGVGGRGNCRLRGRAEGCGPLPSSEPESDDYGGVSPCARSCSHRKTLA